MKPDKNPNWKSSKNRLSFTFIVRAIFTVSCFITYVIYVVNIFTGILSKARGEEAFISTGILYAAMILFMFVEILFPGDAAPLFLPVFIGSISSFPALAIFLMRMLFPEFVESDTLAWIIISIIVASWFLAIYVAYKWRKERYEMGYCKKDLIDILMGPKGPRKK
ncbi:MAG: hypothetical protein IJ198_14025 [Lachnospiraceae bacterium]|nr:hypothetical protein [Lachnospiraceae bacterium]